MTHLIINCYGCDKNVLRDAETIWSILRDGPVLAGLTTVRTVVEKIGTDDNYGYTGVVVLKESHMSIHTWTLERFVAVDLYSCKDFDTGIMVQYVKNMLGAETVRFKVVPRSITLDNNPGDWNTLGGPAFPHDPLASRVDDSDDDVKTWTDSLLKWLT